MVAEFDAGEEAGCGEFDEIAINRGPVESLAAEAIGDFRVAEGILGRREFLHDRQTSGGGAETGGADLPAAGFGRRDGGLSGHLGGLGGVRSSALHLNLARRG